MQIQVNHDHNIEGYEALSTWVRAEVENALSRVSHQITRVEVHLSDQIGQDGNHRNGHNDKRCVMEARLEGHRPTAVTSQAESLGEAVESAVVKLTHLVENTLAKAKDRIRRTPNPSPLSPEPEDDR